MSKAVRVLACGLLAVALPGAAMAATATTTFAVTAAVLNVCTVAATPMVFGNYDPTSASPTDGTSVVTVLCTFNQPYNVRLSQGTNGSAVTARQMIRTGGTELLGYSLFRDASRTLNWGQTDTTDTLDDTGTAVAQLHTVYGRIAAGSGVPAGAYTDTVTVTVDY